MLGQAASYDESIAELPGGATEGFYSMTPVLFVAASDTRPAVKAFADRYRTLYGKDPNFAAQLGYTAAQLIVLGLQRAGKDLNADSFVAGMESIKDWHDIFGSPAMTFGPAKHQGSNESFLCVVKGGHWVPVSTSPYAY
jgi:branched-chain amino acid transport system substrate-binding protein